MLTHVSLQVKKNYEALRQREEEERMVHSSPPRGGEEPQVVSKWEKESHEATRELLKVKDRLIEVERNVSQHNIRTAFGTFPNMNCEQTHLGCVLFSECILVYPMSYIMCLFFPECHTAGREGGPEEPAQTAGNSEL